MLNSLLLNSENIKTHYSGCERKLVWQKDNVKLWYYRQHHALPGISPLLLIYAFINRPTILDINQEYSFIQALLSQGLEIYLIEWGDPNQEQSTLHFLEYLNYIKPCVSILRQHHHTEKINVLGICQGGNLALAYTALYPQQIAHLITLVTPVNFHAPRFIISELVRNIDVNLFHEKFGNIPGKLLAQFFLSLKPYQLTIGKWLQLHNIQHDQQKLQQFLLVEKWLYDTVDHPGQAFLDYCQHYYNENLLIQGKIKFGSRRVQLNNITLPVLNIIALQDHIVPPASSEYLKNCIDNTYYQQLKFNIGHIGIFISQQVLPELTTAIKNFCQENTGE
ncbi:MAG: alpha/beta fold hydrolase [Legionellales bacterium]|nr:alpha/beta fold hydrolase [Legionellales bacterium]